MKHYCLKSVGYSVLNCTVQSYNVLYYAAVTKSRGRLNERPSQEKAGGCGTGRHSERAPVTAGRYRRPLQKEGGRYKTRDAALAATVAQSRGRVEERP